MIYRMQVMKNVLLIETILNMQLWSNHFKYGGYLLCDHISKRITGKFVHGHSPDDLLTASITSLVKDKYGNYCDTNSIYDGIDLFMAKPFMFWLCIIIIP